MFVRRSIFLLLLVFLPLWASAQPTGEINVSASIEPGIIYLGQSATYTIRVDHTSTVPNISPPDVPGLHIVGTGQRTMTNIINGRRSAELQLTFSVSAGREGIFNIPGPVLRLRGEDYRVNDVTLRVQPMDSTLRQSFDLILERPERPLYVGEAVPVTLKLLVRQGVSVALGGIPEREGSSFAQSPLPDQPRQGVQQVEGIPHQFAAWDLVLNPIQKGTHDLQYRLPLVYENRDRVQRDFFGRPRAAQERIVLSTGQLGIEVQELPSEDRPPSFRNAIGTFEVDAALSERTVRAGEPITLTVTLTGQGNFERMGAPELDTPPGWRAYPPRARFEQDDDRGLTGTKTFEYLLIPEHEEIKSVPEFEFSYFDPERARYNTVVFDAEPIDVLPAERVGVARDFGQRRRAETGPAQPQALHPIKSMVGDWKKTLRPPIASAWFWMATGAPVLLFALLGLWLRRQSKRNADNRSVRLRNLNRSARRSLSEADKAAEAGDRAAFLDHARRALQESAARWDEASRQPTSLVESEIRALFEKAGGSEALHHFTSRIFSEADAGKYGGISMPDGDLREDLARLRKHLSELDRLPS